MILQNVYQQSIVHFKCPDVRWVTLLELSLYNYLIHLMLLEWSPLGGKTK